MTKLKIHKMLSSFIIITHIDIDSNNIKYLIPTGTKPTKTKGLISYLLKINEFDQCHKAN